MIYNFACAAFPWIALGLTIAIIGSHKANTSK